MIASGPRPRETVEVAGLVVDSDLELPAGRPAAPGTPVDLSLAHRDGNDLPVLDQHGQPLKGQAVVAELVADGRRYQTLVRRPSGWVLAVHGVATFTISEDLATVRWRAEPGVAPALVSVLTAGTLLGVVSRLRGECVLHAGAVELDGGACAIIGDSGTGKSTTAALLATTGAPLVADDVARVAPGPPPEVLGSTGELRLRQGARGVIDHFADPVAVRLTADGRLAVRPPATSRPRLPLGLLVAPVPVRPNAAVATHRCSPAEAAVVITAADRVPHWRDPDRRAEHFGFAAQLADTVAVVRLEIPWALPVPPGVAGQVRAALEEAMTTGREAEPA